jgi:deoxyribose-phosphate aldolase
LDNQALEQLVAQIGEEIIARMGITGRTAGPTAGQNIPDQICSGCREHCAEACAAKTREIIAAGAARVNAGERVGRIDPAIAALIDHTILKPEATEADVRKVCAEARRYSFASVCVNAFWVPLVAAELKGAPVKVCTVVGFPLGATSTEAKRAEAGAAIQAGAQEIDMVINVGALRSGNLDAVKKDIQAVVEVSHAGGATVKVILETALLDDNQKAVACTLAKLAGADFVKTSTGFAAQGATVHDIALMRMVVGPEMGVKASGGVRTLDDVRQMAAAGATRIGASASVKIIEATAAA